MLRIKPRSGHKETSHEAIGMAMQDISATHNYPRHMWYLEFLENDGLMFYLARAPLLTDNERIFKLYGPLRSLRYNDEGPNDTITFLIQKDKEQALKEIAVSKMNCEFDMIQPMDFKEAMKDKIRTNSNLIPHFSHTFINNFLPKAQRAKRTRHWLPGRERLTILQVQRVEKKQRPMANIKEIDIE